MERQKHIFEEILEVKFEVLNFTAEVLGEQGIFLVGFRMCPDQIIKKWSLVSLKIVK